MISWPISILLVVGVWSFAHLLRGLASRAKDLKSNRKFPPGPLGLPVLGNLLMMGDLPYRNLHQLASKYGPIMSMRLGLVPTIVVSSPQGAELFLKTHDIVFASRPKNQAGEYILYNRKDIGLSEYGPYWRNVRKICTLQLFSVLRIDSFRPMRKEELGNLVAWFKNEAEAYSVVDLSAKVAALTKSMTYRMVFGHRSQLKDGIPQEIIREAVGLVGAFNIADYVPYLGFLDLQGLIRRMKAASRVTDKFLETVIDEHVQDAKNLKGNDRDFIDVMVSLMMEPDEEQYTIDRTNIKAIILDMLLAGIDTTANAIIWTMSELIRHPQVMKKVQAELESAVGMDRMIEETDLTKLHYLDMVIKESMRLHPVAPLMLPHESMEDINVLGYNIPKKSQVIVNVWAIGRDPKVWSDNAEEFIPERFIDTKIDLRGHDFQLLPFGAGRRGCPGLQLGLTTTKLVVAQLSHRFNWDMPSGMSPGDLDMSEKYGLAMTRANNLCAVPTYRLNLNN